MKKNVPLIIIALFLVSTSTYAETIYTWEGKDGVMKFSNSPPPEEVTDYKTIQTPDTGTGDPASNSQRRSSFDRMVRKASEAANASSEQRKKEAAAKAAQEQRIAEERQKAQILEERKRLEDQIEAIEKRAVSKTYSNGMKQAQIDALRKKIEKLEQRATP